MMFMKLIESVTGWTGAGAGGDSDGGDMMMHTHGTCNALQIPSVECYYYLFFLHTYCIPPDNQMANRLRFFNNISICLFYRRNIGLYECD